MSFVKMKSSFLLIIIFSLTILTILTIGCTEDPKDTVVGAFIKLGADDRSYSGAVEIDDFFAPETGGGHTYNVVRPSQSVYLKFSSEATGAINAAATTGVISASVAGDLLPIISDLKMAFDLYASLDEMGMVQGRFYSDKKAIYYAGIVVVADAESITDPEKVGKLVVHWLRKRVPLLSVAGQPVELNTDFYVLNDRWVVFIVTTSPDLHEHLTSHAPEAKNN